MTWAPWREASTARSSCFSIIDSLSPVQLAWTSAARTLRALVVVTSRRDPRPSESRSVVSWSLVGRGYLSSRPAGETSARGGPLVVGRFGGAPVVVLGELPTSTVGIDPALEDGRPLPIDG